MPETWFRGNHGRQHAAGNCGDIGFDEKATRKAAFSHGNSTRRPLPNPRNRLVAVRRQLWYLTARVGPAAVSAECKTNHPSIRRMAWPV
jgi:hypothetical protein